MKRFGVLLFVIFNLSNACRITKSTSQNITLRSLLNNQRKVESFSSFFKQEYPYLRNGCLLIIDNIFLVSNNSKVGIFSFTPKVNHLAFEKFFFNYPDSLIFIQKYDTLKWNNEIENLLKLYNDSLTSHQKGALQLEKL